MNEQSPTLFDTLKQPSREKPVLLLDQTFSSPKPAAILGMAKEWQVELHDKHFAKDEKDHLWIPVAARRGWLILSCDKRIRRWRAEGGLARQAAIESRAKIFFCGRGGRPLADYAYDIGTARHKVLRLAKNNQGPFFARILRHGIVEQFYLKRPQTKRDKTRRKYGNVI